MLNLFQHLFCYIAHLSSSFVTRMQEKGDFIALKTVFLSIETTLQMWFSIILVTNESYKPTLFLIVKRHIWQLIYNFLFIQFCAIHLQQCRTASKLRFEDFAVKTDR
jgi:hypothetical protein